jgi:hypothetical protein
MQVYMVAMRLRLLEGVVVGASATVTAPSLAMTCAYRPGSMIVRASTLSCLACACCHALRKMMWHQMAKHILQKGSTT